MRTIIGLLSTFLLLVWPTLSGASQERVEGLWAGPNSIFEVVRDGDTLTGSIRALLHPRYLPEEDTGRDGEMRTDSNNPEESLRNRSLIGLSMFSGYQFEDGRWQGEIYDPESGNIYQSRMSLNKKGELEIRGYIGMPMFGRTSTFIPVSRCTPEVLTMLAQMTAKSACDVSSMPQKD